MYLYVVQVVVVARDRFGHGQRQPLPIGKIERIGRPALFPPLIFYLFPAPDGRGMATVKVTAGKVDIRLVARKKACPTVPPYTLAAPFPIMAENGLII